MTTLEKFLGAALAVVGSSYAYTVVSTIKHNKKQLEGFAEIEEHLKEMGQVLDEAEKKCVKDEETV